MPERAGLVSAAVEASAGLAEASLLLPDSTNVTEWLLKHFLLNDGTVHGAVTGDWQRFGNLAIRHVGSEAYLGPGAAPYPADAATFARAWFDMRDMHSLPAYLHVANQGLLQVLGNVSTTAYNHPLDATVDTKLQEYITSGTDITVAIFILFGLSFLPASVFVFIVKERVDRARHLQLASGLSPGVLWFGHYLFDLSTYFIACLLCIVVFEAFGLPAYTGHNALPMALLIVSYGFAVIPLMYMLTGLYSVPATAYVSAMVLNVAIGLTATLATFILDWFPTLVALAHVNELLKNMLAVFPQFCLGRAILNVARHEYEYQYSVVSAALVGDAAPAFQSAFQWHVIGKYLLAIWVHALIWPGLLMVTVHWREVGRCLAAVAKRGTRGLGPLAEDQDEEMLPFDGSATSGIVVTDLHVSYALPRTWRFWRARSRREAVKDVSLHVMPGTCYGLLGVNGAGKTSTFRCLVGERDVGRGVIHIGGFDMHDARGRALQHLGYCPQVDALLDRLTVRESLQLFASIRGLANPQAAMTIGALVGFLQLTDFVDLETRHLSGGNRRRLSFGLAILGPQSVVCLDEPSAAIDILGRRFLWSCIAAMKAMNKAVLMTSHSMDECELCCDYFGIMAGGRLVQHGTLEELRARFGDYFSLEVNAPGKTGVQIREAIEAAFGSAQVLSEHGSYVQVRLPAAQCHPLHVALQRAGNLEQELEANLMDLRQATLHDVFLNIVQQAAETVEVAKGSLNEAM
ncbi:uncharacterized protein MONBRDRAFT_15980 [Monosiga brevicollis MX1]|uniref:ABC transporter domain-containing protein n=1 Tax=Monosiga brevicollis TaxID=81824 RepID=A9UVF4_MONBE|nr:uncharacterized protein MONBRDRAFT_15980 [Monosiga brevicollis MX1]EDQ90570.1 predicted protein [Monosiga brevicollis MX1]|eukprot:XP_001744621.1 hypothetical protein [Monosiga brevicollis MX1]